VGTLSLFTDGAGNLLATARAQCGWLFHQPAGAAPANAIDTASTDVAADAATLAAPSSRAGERGRARANRPLLLPAGQLPDLDVLNGGDDASLGGCSGLAADLQYGHGAAGTSSCLTLVLPAARVQAALQGGGQQQLAVLTRFTVTQFSGDSCTPVGGGILRSAGPVGAEVQQLCGGVSAITFDTACSAAAATASILSAAAAIEGVSAKRLAAAPAAVAWTQAPPAGRGYGAYGSSGGCSLRLLC
jgi:hypothetical protein